MNIIRAPGVPWGTRWASMWLVFFVQPNNINANQNVNEIGSVIVKCEVGEKTWGYKARKFITMISKNADMIINSTLFSVLFKVNLTSFLKVITIFFNNFVWDGLVFHNGKANIRGDRIRTSQDKEKREELGSNTENKLVIILSCFVL